MEFEWTVISAQTALARTVASPSSGGYRYLDEVIKALAVQAQDLHEAGPTTAPQPENMFSASRTGPTPTSICRTLADGAYNVLLRGLRAWANVPSRSATVVTQPGLLVQEFRGW